MVEIRSPQQWAGPPGYAFGYFTPTATQIALCLRVRAGLARGSRVFCPQCGGDDVEHSEWYAPNANGGAGEVHPNLWEGFSYAASLGHTFCNDCADHPVLVYMEPGQTGEPH
jgi:hypothetical protein